MVKFPLPFPTQLKIIWQAKRLKSPASYYSQVLRNWKRESCTAAPKIFGLWCRMMTRRKQLKMHPSDSKINHWKLCRKKRRSFAEKALMHHIYLLPPSARPPSFCHGSSLYLWSCKVSSWLPSSPRPSASVIFLFYFFCCEGVFLPRRRWQWLSVCKLDLQKQIQGFLRQLVLTRNHNGRVSRSELGFLSCFHVTLLTRTFRRRPEPLNLWRWGAAAALDTGFPS